MIDDKDCDFCGKTAEKTFTYPDDPGFEYFVCANCPRSL
jgi:hypothetical protein